MRRRLRRWWNRKYWRGYSDGIRETSETWAAVIIDALEGDVEAQDDVWARADRELGLGRK